VAVILAFLLAGLSNTLKQQEFSDIYDPLFLQQCQGREIHEIKGA